MIDDLEAFVAKIVRNKKLELVRRIRLRFERELLTADPEQLIKTDCDSIESLWDEEFIIQVNQQKFKLRDERLYSALMKLDAMERDVILLRYMGQWSMSDIAKAQGVTTKTVYVRCKHGLAFLRMKLYQAGTERETSVDEQNDPRRSKRRSQSNPRGP